MRCLSCSGRCERTDLVPSLTADFVVDCTSVDYRDPKSEATVRFLIPSVALRWLTSLTPQSRALVTSLLAHWKSSPVEDDPLTPLSISRRSQARTSTYTLFPATDDSANETFDKRRPSQLAQTAILLRRSHLNVYRDMPQLAGLLGQAVVLGLFLGFNSSSLQHQLLYLFCTLTALHPVS